jgi:hypothetical protein
MTSDELHIVCYGFEKLKNHIYIHAAKNGEFLHKILVKYQGQWNLLKNLFEHGGSSYQIPANLFLYVNLLSKGAPKFFKALVHWLTVLDIPYLADPYSCTMRPIYRQLLRPIPRTQLVMIQLYNTALTQSTSFPHPSISPSRTQPGPLGMLTLSTALNFPLDSSSILFDHSVGFPDTLCTLEKSIHW